MVKIKMELEFSSKAEMLAFIASPHSQPTFKAIGHKVGSKMSDVWKHKISLGMKRAFARKKERAAIPKIAAPSNEPDFSFVGKSRKTASTRTAIINAIMKQTGKGIIEAEEVITTAVRMGVLKQLTPNTYRRYSKNAGKPLAWSTKKKEVATVSEFAEKKEGAKQA